MNLTVNISPDSRVPRIWRRQIQRLWHTKDFNFASYFFFLFIYKIGWRESKGLLHFSYSIPLKFLGICFCLWQVSFLHILTLLSKHDRKIGTQMFLWILSFYKCHKYSLAPLLSAYNGKQCLFKVFLKYKTNWIESYIFR